MKTEVEYLQQAIARTWFADLPQEQRDKCIKHYRGDLHLMVAGMMFRDAINETWIMRQVYRFAVWLNRKKEAAQ